MTMPEAAVDKDSYLKARQNNVRAARKRAGMQTVAKALFEQGAPNLEFWLRIAATHSGHVSAARRWRKMIGHLSAIIDWPSAGQPRKATDEGGR